MADAQFRLSRRALLGVACASAPVLAAAAPSVRFEPSREAVPSEAEAFRPAWSRALAVFNRADAAITALEGKSDDETFNRAADAHDRALERLLLAPAPDVAALAAKLRLARVHQVWELRAGEALMEALERDALVLDGRAAPRPRAPL